MAHSSYAGDKLCRLRDRGGVASTTWGDRVTVMGERWEAVSVLFFGVEKHGKTLKEMMDER